MKKRNNGLKIVKNFKNSLLTRTSCLALTLVVLTGYAKSADASTEVKKSEVIPADFVQEFIDYSNYVSNTPSNTNENTQVDEVIAVADEVVEPTNEEKLAIILERENLTSLQFAEILATVIGEAEANSYDDAYAVINTFYNRKISKTWINEVLRVTGEDNGDNLYVQITLDGQSSVYTQGTYKLYLGITDVPAYQAVIDFLYTLEPMHDYLNFFASYGTISNSVQFSENGNWYYNAMPEEDRVLEDVISLVRTNE